MTSSTTSASLSTSHHGCPFAGKARAREAVADELDLRIARVRRRAVWLGVALSVGLLLLAPTHPELLVGAGALVLAACVLLRRVPGLALVVDVLRFGLGGVYRMFWRLLERTRSSLLIRNFAEGGRLLLVRGCVDSNQVLTRAADFEREPLPNYTPFNTRCVLGAGGGADWLRYRQVFNDYFSQGYRDDLPMVAEIVAERMPAWRAAGQIELLRALLEIVIEIRGRVFFQYGFGCFDRPPSSGAHEREPSFVDLVQRTLVAPIFMLDRDDEGVCERFHAELRRAIAAAHSPGSIGHTCKTSAQLSETEALQNASMYVLALAPSFAAFWLLYRAAATRSLATLRGDRRALLAAIKEELRIHPPVPRMMNRRARRDTEVAGQAVPEGTQAIVGPLFTQHHPDLWDAPERFCPSRWTIHADSAAEILRESVEEHPRYYPFGLGRHQCQGRKFAVEELVLLVETILAHVDLEVVEDADLIDRPIAEQITLSVFALPVHDVIVRVRPV